MFKKNGVPLDVSVQLLYYRKDLFLNKLVQREFYERFRKELICTTKLWKNLT